MTAWVADVLMRELGLAAAVVPLEQRAGCDLYRADGVSQSVLVKVGRPARLAHEADNLRLASTLVGDLAPALIGYAETADGPAVLAMEYLPGSHLEPGGLRHAAWRSLVDGLLQLHSQGPGGRPRCCPLAPDFVTLSVGEERYASLPELRQLLIAEMARVPDLDLRVALALFDDLAADVKARPALFERPPCWVHADLWPENMLVRGSRCRLVDWTWLKQSEYALDLANLKLTLDWVWPAWRAQTAFERLLRLYVNTFADDTLLTRMRFFLPIVSLTHLIQFGQGGADDPENAAAMRACLAKALRDRALWSLGGAHGRLVYAMAHRLRSEYGVADQHGVRTRAARVVARLMVAGRRAVRRDPAGHRASAAHEARP